MNCSSSLLYCISCGSPLDDQDLNDLNKLTEPKELREICSVCTLNHKYLPSFKSIVLGMANGYFIQKMGLKNQTMAIKKAWNIITKLPYWQEHPSDWIMIDSLNFIQDFNFEELQMTAHIFMKMSKVEDINIIKERSDIFISYSWSGPYLEFIDELVNNLKDRGYNVWYDKDTGLKPGELEKYLKDAIIDSRNCIPIICKEYFNGDYTKYELEMLFNTKNKKHIIPIWWSDVDSEYIKKQGSFGEQILKTSGITWKNCSFNIKILITQLEEYLTTIEEKEIYNGVKLYESEAQFMNELDKCLVDLDHRIPILEDLSLSKKSREFGFSHKGGHIIELILRRMIDGRTITSLNLPNSFKKLKKIEKLDVPLLKIPKGISKLKYLKKLNIQDGMLDTLPEEFGNLNLTQYEIFNFSKNPNIVNIDKKANKIIDLLIEKDKLYMNLSKDNARILYLIQIGLGITNEIPQIDEIYSNNFGYVIKDNLIKSISLYNNKIKNFPALICKISSLEELYLRENHLSSIPDGIGNLKSLKILDLQDNIIKYLPEKIINLESLRILNISSNQLNSLPNEIGKLAMLEELIIECNQITSIPISIGNLKSLKSLNIFSNLIKEVPNSIGNLVSLKELNLGSNSQLISIPDSIKNLNSLEIIHIGNSQLYEYISNLFERKNVSINVL